MSEYVESGYVEDGYVEGSNTEPTVVTCDLTQVNTKLDLILTKLSSMDGRLISLETLINDSKQTVLDTLQDEKEILLNVVSGQDEISNSIGNNIVSLSAINAIVSDIRTTVNNDLISIENIKDIIPMVDDLSLRIYPIGTLVDVIGVDGVCEVVASSMTPYDDYGYICDYTVKLMGSNRVSNFPAQVVTKHIEVV